MNSENDSIYQQIQQEVEQTMHYFGIDFRLSGDISAAVTRKLQKLFSGSTVYFPMRDSTQSRYAAIKEDYRTTCDPDAVCKKHGISKKTLYRALGSLVTGRNEPKSL